MKHLILTIAFIVSGLRFLYVLVNFAFHSLQIDFSAFYTAGEALNHGLSPYINNIHHSPAVWDGINDYQHSRFLYPPLVAALFQPIALLPYLYAKILWGIFSLLCVILALYIVSHVFATKRPDQVLLLSIGTCWYYPLLTHFERSQIDVVTLLWLTLFAFYIARQERQRLSGLFLAAAVLFKLHSIYVLPFLIVRKHWQTLQGFVIAISVMFMLSITVPNGRALLKDYLVNEMPRIANYGQPDHGDVPLDPKVIQAMIKDVPNGYTIKDGRLYLPVALDFVSNATLVRPIHDRLLVSGVNPSFAVLSLAVFSIIFVVFQVWQYYFFSKEKCSPEKEFLYWLAVLTVILLSAPLTHVMNTVWLLPVLIALIASHNQGRPVRQNWGYGLMLSGILLIGIPDSLLVDLQLHVILELIQYKYLIGEGMVLLGCLVHLSELTWLRVLSQSELSYLKKTVYPN